MESGVTLTNPQRARRIYAAAINLFLQNNTVKAEPVKEGAK